MNSVLPRSYPCENITIFLCSHLRHICHERRAERHPAFIWPLNYLQFIGPGWSAALFVSRGLDLRLIRFLCRGCDSVLSNPLTCRGLLSSGSLNQQQEHGFIQQDEGPLCPDPGQGENTWWGLRKKHSLWDLGRVPQSLLSRIRGCFRQSNEKLAK